MRESTQKELELLIKSYTAARDKMLNIIINYKGVGTKVYYNTVLQNLNKTLESLQAKSDEYVNTAIPEEYKAALDETYAYFQKNNLLMSPPAAFSQIHTDAVYELAREMQYNIGQGLEQAGRQVQRYLDESRDNTLRKIGLESAAEKAASGSTVLDMQKNMIDKLQDEGFMTVQYGSGKNAYQVGIDSYAAMVARSTTREAGNLARENQLTENGYDLVKMTEHHPTCGICAQLQGRVYSVSGDDKRFPPLSQAFKSGYRNVHPNCRHSVHPWIESMQSPEELQETIDKSNKPFKDLRPEEEKTLYNKQQIDNRKMRQDRYQYERYKTRLGDDAPKSFSAFRRMKKVGGEKWGVLQAKYKSLGYYERAIKNEPAITKAVTEVAESSGMDVKGLQQRIKSKESYLRKIELNYNPSGTEYEVKDILRYTFTAPSSELADKTMKSIDLFADKGYNVSELKNYWLDNNNPYNGINTFMKSPNGQRFEVQYHTPESFGVKNEKMHTIYEEWRLLTASDPKRSLLAEEMKKISQSMIPPNNIERVK
jgi:hypothetical protein